MNVQATGGTGGTGGTGSSVHVYDFSAMVSYVRNQQCHKTLLNGHIV